MKLNSSSSKCIIRIGCLAHVFNNWIQNAVGCLPINVEVVVVVVKILKYFDIYIVKAAKLQYFCEEAGVEYRGIIYFFKSDDSSWKDTKNTWTTEIVFLSLNNCPTIIKQFSEKPDGKLCLFYTQHLVIPS